MNEAVNGMEEALDGILNKKFGYQDFCSWCLVVPNTHITMNLGTALNLFQQIYQAGTGQAAQAEQPTQKGEVLAGKYVLDFSKAQTWPRGLTDMDSTLLTRASESGDFDVETVKPDIVRPFRGCSCMVFVEGDWLVLEGEVGHQPVAAVCTIKTPKSYEDGSNPQRNYTVSIDVDHEESFRELKGKLESYGVRFIAQE